MKSLVSLWNDLANELAGWCHTSCELDSKTVAERTENEGISFLTITLPNFGKEFERALDRKAVDSDAFIGFRKRGPLPLLLEGFLRQVFCSKTGVLLDQPSADAVFAVRELTLLYSKIQLPTSPRRTREAFRQYVQTDQGVRSSVLSYEHRLSDLARIATLVFGDVLSAMDRKVYEGDVTGRHGPGSVADGLVGNGKYDLLYWPERLERVFSYLDHALPNARYYEHYDRVVSPGPDSEMPVKVISVPKTLKTPRIIAIEPACMQYMQQALAQPLVELLESKIVGGCTSPNPAYELLGFTDQMPNRHMAYCGSLDGHLATLDLSEASDRVSVAHVRALLQQYPHFLEAVEATRSTKARVPGHGVIPLSKFASMGSALTFPLEAMVFLSIVLLGYERKRGRRLTRSDVLSLRGELRVYGDDIIIPTDMVEFAICELEAFGFKVNSHKSFWNGSFRESCGGDYFAGSDVTPIRFRRVMPRGKRDASEVASLVSFRNQLYNRGLWKTAAKLDDRITKLLSFFPPVAVTSSLLGRLTFLDPISGSERLDENTHTPVVKGWRLQPVIPISCLDDVGALVKCLTIDTRDATNREHLKRYGRPQVVNMKLGWKAPF